MTTRKQKAKDAAFERERAHLRHERNELQRELAREREAAEGLRMEIEDMKSQMSVKDDWIERLLEFTELTPAQIQNVLADEKRDAEIRESLSAVLGANGPMGEILRRTAPLIRVLDIENPRDEDLSVPVPNDSPLEMVAKACRDADGNPAISVFTRNAGNGDVAQDVVQVSSDGDSMRVLLWGDAYDEDYTQDTRIALYEDAGAYRKGVD